MLISLICYNTEERRCILPGAKKTAIHARESPRTDCPSAFTLPIRDETPGASVKCPLDYYIINYVFSRRSNDFLFPIRSSTDDRTLWKVIGRDPTANLLGYCKKYRLSARASPIPVFEETFLCATWWLKVVVSKERGVERGSTRKQSEVCLQDWNILGPTF